MAEKRQKYGRRFIKIVDFPNFPDPKVMKRKSNVYGQIYLHIFDFFLRLFRAKFDFLILS